jgi:hypothetical protein
MKIGSERKKEKKPFIDAFLVTETRIVLTNG